VRDTDALTRSLLRVVAQAAVDGRSVTVAELTGALGEDEVTVRATVRELGVLALHRDLTLVIPQEEGAEDRVAPDRATHFAMEPQRAQFVLAALDLGPAGE
jgi:hypothetical protein